MLLLMLIRRTQTEANMKSKLTALLIAGALLMFPAAAFAQGGGDQPGAGSSKEQ